MVSAQAQAQEPKDDSCLRLWFVCLFHPPVAPRSRSNIADEGFYRLGWKFSQDLQQRLEHLLRSAFEEFTAAGHKERVTCSQ